MAVLHRGINFKGSKSKAILIAEIITTSWVDQFKLIPYNYITIQYKK